MKTLFHVEEMSPFLGEQFASSVIFLNKKQGPVGIRDCENYKSAYIIYLNNFMTTHHQIVSL